ncbi:MAG: hypothetical protein ACHQ1D_01130 [Nitrososphaerales archaeon]
MNFLNIIIGTGLVFMGLYTFSISGWDWISIIMGVAQLIVGIYLFWTGIRREQVYIPQIPGGFYNG